MPRKGHIAKRTVPADAVYQSDLVTKFINSMMWQGKRSTAEGIFYEALAKVQEKGGDEALKLFKKAVENAKPLLEVKTPPRRWRELSGAGRSECRPPHIVGDSLADHLCARSWRKRHGRQVDRMNCWTLLPERAPRSRRKKMCTGWRKPIRRSRITGGRESC